MQEETDITDKTELKWGDGYIAVRFTCECGQVMLAYTGRPYKCSCGLEYWIACRVMMRSTKDDPEHNPECHCVKCECHRANYQTNFEEEHDL